ncbi:metabotropic glutamate receptor-like [Limulus polyphemus]|uniref:Metabotropic glutamate receptor-like n=1 Tax=Limulus polyphemus TaxID=6850 RepID=A0ABM1SQ17_LIMPO|nr:metabotropic glutamate receptor-like [Limulus polyphemus]
MNPKSTVMCVVCLLLRALVVSTILWLAVYDLGASALKAHIPGDIIFGGLFPIHKKNAKSKCGPINKDRGIQRTEAMLFAIDKINQDPSILGDIKLGAIILDTCSSDSYALNQSLEFIRASINTVDSSAFECQDGTHPKLKFSNKAIRGVIGGSYSEVSLQVANLLRLFRIPQVSPASTGTSLSDKSRYDFFARTVPPDTFQAVALVDLVQLFNWSYVSLVSSEGQYGDSGMKAFQQEARARNICIAVNDKVPHSASKAKFDEIYRNLLTKSNARGVVLFTRAEDSRGILEAAKRTGSVNTFAWVASDGWGTQDKLVEGLEAVAEGAITVELQSKEINEFDWYMKNLTPLNNRRNPWFEEYWEDVFSCTLPHNVNHQINNTVLVCSTNLRLDESVGYKQESKVQFVVDAVYSIAHALHRVWENLCGPYGEGYCEEMRELDGGVLYRDYLLNVSFIDLAGSEVKFNHQGDGLGRYIIYNYQRIGNSSLFEYKRLGRWLDGLHLDLDEVVWNQGRRQIPVSICSAPCGVGEVKKMQVGDICCWICSSCKPWEYVLDEFTCADCGHGRWPYADKASCYDITQQYMRWNSYFAIVPIGVSCLGIFLTSTVIIVFLQNNDTPIVKASGRELSYMLLTGILICFFMTFVLLAKPSMVICGLQRFGVGFGFSIIYSSLLTKTNRISRIFDSARKSASRPSFISPKSQVVITLIFIAVQVIGTMVWFVIEPPGTKQYYPDGKRNQVILKCRIKDSSFLISLAYNMFLITICTVYAVKTRKIPENFNESKFIGFTMYTTCIVWLAFVPIYFGTGNSFEVQITTLCVSISLSAFVALFCLFSPKVYIIVFHPDKNVRKLTMNSATYKKAPTSSTCGTTNHGSSAEQVKLTVQTTPSKTQTESDRDSLASL